MELREYLKSILLNKKKNNSDGEQEENTMISWQTLSNNFLFEKSKRYMANKHFKILTREDILREYLTFVTEYENELSLRLSTLNERNYTRDRIARDNYKSLLLQTSKFKIRANSNWKDFYMVFKNDKKFQDLLGRNGSTVEDQS